MPPSIERPVSRFGIECATIPTGQARKGTSRSTRCEAVSRCTPGSRIALKGTTTLFAALEVATGKIIATHSKRRRRVEFLDFMNSVTAAFPKRQLHVILDNLNTHKKNEHWLKAHPNVQFHFTPTNASWLNQVEVWFSTLQGKSLSGASFTSLKQLEQHIDAYIKAYNDKAEPFVWAKKKVRQRRFKGSRITQL
jgi:transposase